MQFRRTAIIIAATVASLVALGNLRVLVPWILSRTAPAPFEVCSAGGVERIGDFQRVVELCTRALKGEGPYANLDEERGRLLAHRAKAFEGLQQFASAEADWSARLEIKPLPARYQAAYYGDRAFFHLRREAHDKALADFAAARRLDSSNASYLVGEAQVLTALREHRAAVERYTAALALAPTNDKIRIERADAESRAGLHAEARDDYGQIIARHEAAASNKKMKAAEIAPVYMTRGLASLRLGDYRRAIADFDQVVEMAPTSVDALRWRGEAYERMGDRFRALVDYRAALALDLRDDDAAERMFRVMGGR